MYRICIYTQDVKNITGKCDKSCRAIIKAIRQLHNKQHHQCVTLQELCNYLGLDPEETKKAIK